MNKTSVALVLFSIVALVNAQCSCQNKPPIDVKYQREACECGRHLPIQIEVPKITEHRDAHYDYGFTIERPQAPPAEVKYTFDFHMEKPKPQQTATLATYGFEVDTPVQEQEVVPQRYNFDYQIQKPIAQSGPANLQDLFAQVDRIVVQKSDCQEKSGCSCNSYKPTIDLLQRCPRHGHLYRYGGSLYPHRQRYNKDSNSNKQQTVDQISTTSARSKRSVANSFPIIIQNILPGLRPNNQILKSDEDENRTRIEEIIKKNFGEDQSENFDELLRPKPLVVPVKTEKNEEKVKVTDVPLTSDFIAKLKPKFEEAKANFRSRITKIVNKARLDAIKANHMIKKRSTESNEFDESDMFLDADEHFDGNYEPIWMTDESVESDKIENSISEPKNYNVATGETSTGDRFRKHCDRCGELAKKFPCPSCGGIPSDVQMKQQSPIRYAQQQTAPRPTQPKYASDQFDDVNVGSYHRRPAYGELRDILSKNSGAIYEQNRGVGDGHLLQPMDFAHATDAIRFIQELTMRNNQENVDYYSNSNSYDDVGASRLPQNYHSKRSFKIVPLAEKEDGSVFVKISPVDESKVNNHEISLTSSEDSKVKGKTNLKKFARNGKKYQILALNVNGSDGGSVTDEEDYEIVKYIQAVNENRHRANGDASDEIVGESKQMKITETNMKI